jgi:hypothetical protein
MEIVQNRLQNDIQGNINPEKSANDCIGMKEWKRMLSYQIYFCSPKNFNGSVNEHEWCKTQGDRLYAY